MDLTLPYTIIYSTTKHLLKNGWEAGKERGDTPSQFFSQFFLCLSIGQKEGEELVRVVYLPYVDYCQTIVILVLVGEGWIGQGGRREREGDYVWGVRLSLSHERGVD